MNQEINKLLNRLRKKIPPIYNLMQEKKDINLYMYVDSGIIDKNGKAIVKQKRVYTVFTGTNERLQDNLNGMLEGIQLIIVYIQMQSKQPDEPEN